MSEHAGPPAGQAETLAAMVRRKQAGLLGIHGPMLEKKEALEGEGGSALVRTLQGTGPLPRYAGRTLVPGWAEGRLVGAINSNDLMRAKVI